MRTDKKCHICQEDFNDDWECSTLCVHDGCLEKVFQNTSKTYISAVQQRTEFRDALKECRANSLSFQTEDELRVLVELLCHSKGAPGFDQRISRLREEAVAKWKARKQE